MPISAIGDAGRRRRRPDGFTLVELMVVVAILGLATSLAVLNLPGDQERLRAAAEAMAARLVAARDLAIISNRDVRVTIATDGYRFDMDDAGDWRAPTGRAFAPRALPAGVSAAVDSAGPAVLGFDATGLASPARIVLRQGEAQAEIAVDIGGAVHVGG